MSSPVQSHPRRSAMATAVAATAAAAVSLTAANAFVSGAAAPAAGVQQAGLRGVRVASQTQGASSTVQPAGQVPFSQSLAAAAAAVGAAGLAARRKINRAKEEKSSRTARKAFFNLFGKSKKTVIITGASSGLGLHAAEELAKSGDWYVIMACRDFVKGEKVAAERNFPKDSYKVMHCDLSANNSVRNFVSAFRTLDRSVDCLVCNAAVYFPNAHKDGVGLPGLFPGGGPRWSADGHELSFAANYLGHFLLTNLLLDDMKKADQARCIILGTVTASVNGKELGGMVPPLANLGDLSGLKQGMQQPITMIDGGEFDGAKAYKDSKVCDVMLMRELHKRFHKETGIIFSSLYPGCIAETNLFREHYPVFQKLFPVFHQNVTRAYVSQQEAGRRLACVVSDPEYNTSGSYYSWQGKSGTGGEGGNEAKNNTEATKDMLTMNTGGFRTLSVDEIGGEAGDNERCRQLWELSEQLVELEKTNATVESKTLEMA